MKLISRRRTRVWLNGRQFLDVVSCSKSPAPDDHVADGSRTKTAELRNLHGMIPTALSAVVHLRNAVLEEDLQDDELYAELVDDVLTECAGRASGDVDAVEIPRPERKKNMKPKLVDLRALWG